MKWRKFAGILVGLTSVASGIQSAEAMKFVHPTIVVVGLEGAVKVERFPEKHPTNYDWSNDGVQGKGQCFWNATVGDIQASVDHWDVVDVKERLVGKRVTVIGSCDKAAPDAAVLLFGPKYDQKRMVGAKASAYAIQAKHTVTIDQGKGVSLDGLDIDWVQTDRTSGVDPEDPSRRIEKERIAIHIAQGVHENDHAFHYELGAGLEEYYRFTYGPGYLVAFSGYSHQLSPPVIQLKIWRWRTPDL